MSTLVSKKEVDDSTGLNVLHSKALFSRVSIPWAAWNHMKDAGNTLRQRYGWYFKYSATSMSCTGKDWRSLYNSSNKVVISLKSTYIGAVYQNSLTVLTLAVENQFLSDLYKNLRCLNRITKLSYCPTILLILEAELALDIQVKKFGLNRQVSFA